MNNIIGQCHICLKQNKKLSAEHIPPRCCGNKDPVQMKYEFEFERDGRVEKISQNGSKFFSICENCNNGILAEYDNELGSLYNKVYTNFHSENPDKKLIVKCKINKIARSIIGKFLGLSIVVDNTSIEQSLRDYVLNKTKPSIPNAHLTLRLYPYDTYLFARNQLPMGKKHFCKLCDCLYFDPFAFLLTRDLHTKNNFEKIQKDDYNFLDLFKYTTSNIEDEIEVEIDFDSIFDKYTGTMFPYNFPLNAPLSMAIKESGTAQVAIKYNVN